MITRENVYGPPTGILEVMPGDMYQGLLPHMGRDDVGNLMLVSKRVYNTCLDAQLAWKTFLPEKYQGIQDPCTVVIEAWKEIRDIQRSAVRAESNSPSHNSSSDVTQHSLIQESVKRLMSLCPAPGEARDSERTRTPSEIAQWVAIEMCLTHVIRSIEPVYHRGITGRIRTRRTLQYIGLIALQSKDYFSPELFRALSWGCDLMHSFFSLFAEDPHHLDDTQWRDLARFVVENQYKLGLCGCTKGQLEQLETWFGPDLQDLSMEYRILRGEGFIAVRNIGRFSEITEWGQFLLQEFESKQVPVGGIVEIPWSYLRSLVRVSKYIFHDPQQLVHFILSVEQKRNKELLLMLGEHFPMNGFDTAHVDEFLLGFESRLKTMIETVLADDDAPLCSTSEYEKDHDFVYGRLGPYLIERLTMSP